MISNTKYTSISVINHWITAILVIIMLTLGYTAAFAPTDFIEDYIIRIHISVGFFAFILVLWRIFFRIIEGFPKNETKSFKNDISHLNHKLLLFLLLTLVMTGPLYLFTENECVSVFSWFEICIPLEGLPGLHKIVKLFHINIGYYILPALIVLHILGALLSIINNTRIEKS